VKYTMDVRIKESSPNEFVQGELIIIADESGATNSFPIKFSAKVTSDLQVSPEVLTLSGVKTGDSVEKKIIIKGPTEFKILDVMCSNEAFSVSADAESSKKIHFVTVEYSASQPPGKYEYDLEFITDLNQKTSQSIKAVVEIVAGDNQEVNSTPTPAGSQ
ncbi:MAG: hypothetical protein AAGA30_07440, partial [Planctomycetota bacterium]